MRRVRRKAGGKEKVFGCDLLEHLNASSQEVPLVLRCCSEFVETHGIVDGIYRLSGVSSNIQKLRGEFESDRSPDLNKDVFLQDIHCVSSLCKAYFRELPNPLLTYQLYDKFAEAVAIQLEEERLVKIRDVLKELPQQHYKTLEFLMRHLVKMASFSSETNMHARNLAIVWAPNLLRSKDIEASGFNGTAVFKEVRVQSIVVEFILTHVPQLFPEQGASAERRKSLPSPTAGSHLEEGPFKPAPITNIGNISPGAGPLLMRSYHAVIEGTDKRKGSLKGRKWMSIFNIGGRFHEQKRRLKNSAKEKDRPALRPARSMDSLSASSYSNEGLRRSGPRPPSSETPTMSPLATSSSQSGSDASIFTGGLSSSEYAVTYRRGTGCVGSGAGMPGTYTSLDPEGSGAAGSETVQSRSPSHSTKVGRRAAMHITGPTLVLVPLHITSNLALGVLQGGGGTRLIHRSRDKDGGTRLEAGEGQEQAEKRKTREIEWDVRKEEEEGEEKGSRAQGAGVDEVEDRREGLVASGRPEGGDEEKRGEEEEEEEEGGKEGIMARGGEGSREHRIKSLASNTEEESDEGANEDMEPHIISQEEPAGLQTDVTDASSMLNSTVVEGDDLGLFGYVQDNFDFLDQMDCSVLDHMDQYSSDQVHEFSVEPPGHSYNEYEVMDQTQLPHSPAGADLESSEQSGPACHSVDDDYEPMRQIQSFCPPADDERELTERVQSISCPAEQQPHRLHLGVGANTRHVKSLSLPHMTSPVHGPEELGSEEEFQWCDSDKDNYHYEYDSDDDNDSDRDQDMYTKSLPLDILLMPDAIRDVGTQAGRESDLIQVHQQPQISEGFNDEFPECGERLAEDQRQIEGEKDGEGDELEVSTGTEGSADEQGSQADSEQSDETEQTEEEVHRAAEDTQMSDEADMPAGKEEEEAAAESPSDDSLFHAPKDAACSSLVEPTELSLDATEELRASAGDNVREADNHSHKRDSAVDDSVEEGASEEGPRNLNTPRAEEIVHPESGELEAAIRRTSNDIWHELEDVVCEVIEEEESKQSELRREEESVFDQLWDANVIRAGEPDERMCVVFEEATVEADGGKTETEVRLEIIEVSGTTEENVSNEGRDQEVQENDRNSIRTMEHDEGIQWKQTISNKTQLHQCEGHVLRGENKEEQKSTNPGLHVVRSDVTERKGGASMENTDSNQGGVGSKLVAFKLPKIHQVKAVPVVPPKPQHCRITALALRQQQQQQQKERQDPDKGGDNWPRGLTEQGTVGGERAKDRDWSSSGTKERPALRGEEADREERRSSPLSMCFDQAVAKATMRREREKEHEREKQREWSNEAQ